MLKLLIVIRTVALTGKQQEMAQVCEKQLDKKNRGGEERRMDELRVEARVNEGVKKKLTRSMLKSTGRMDRMGYEKTTKKADV